VSWDNTYLPTGVCGVLPFHIQVIGVWSRKGKAWDGVDQEDPAVATALVTVWADPLPKDGSGPVQD